MNTKNLLQIAEEARHIENMLLESGGELTPEIEAALVVIDTHLPAKIDSYQSVIERFEMFSAHHKAKAAQQNALAKQCAAVAEKLQDNLKEAMQRLETDELVGVDVRFKLVASNPACVIEDEAKIDSGYKTIKQETVVDKKRITEDLKLGVPVAGAHLRPSFALKQYANSPSRKETK